MLEIVIIRQVYRAHKGCAGLTGLVKSLLGNNFKVIVNLRLSRCNFIYLHNAKAAGNGSKCVIYSISLQYKYFTDILRHLNSLPAI